MRNNVNAQTSVYGVMGNPVRHSLSPVMHNAAFEEVGWNGVYTAFEVADVENAINGIRSLGIAGVSVTIPHKLSVMPFLDEIDQQAKAIGAVNTIVNKDGHLFGYNSDCTGAVNALLDKTDIAGKKVLLLGAGGAARAVAFGVKSEGAALTIANKFEEEGTALAKAVDARFLMLDDMTSIEADILINATPLGMSPDIDTIPVNPDWITPEMVVMDIVYNPLKTRLLQEAEKRGCVIVDGVSMFVYQGVSQFEFWTGKKAPVALMRSVVLAALTSK